MVADFGGGEGEEVSEEVAAVGSGEVGATGVAEDEADAEEAAEEGGGGAGGEGVEAEVEEVEAVGGGVGAPTGLTADLLNPLRKPWRSWVRHVDGITDHRGVGRDCRIPNRLYAYGDSCVIAGLYMGLMLVLYII